VVKEEMNQQSTIDLAVNGQDPLIHVQTYQFKSSFAAIKEAKTNFFKARKESQTKTEQDLKRMREKSQGKNLELDDIVDYLKNDASSVSGRRAKPEVSTPQLIHDMVKGLSPANALQSILAKDSMKTQSANASQHESVQEMMVSDDDQHTLGAVNTDAQTKGSKININAQNEQKE